MSHIHFLERQPSTSDRFAKAFANAGQTAASAVPQHMLAQEQKKKEEMYGQQQREAIQRLTGLDVSGIRDPKMQQAILEYTMKGQQQESKNALKLQGQQAESQAKQQEKMAPFHSAIETINEMRQIGSKNNLGRGSAITGFFGGETAKDRAKYSQLGKSLISLASTIPIRNQMEFETLANDLYDPSLPDSAREGILDAMEHIVRSSLGEYSPSESYESQEIGEEKILDESSIKKIFELAKGDKEKAKKIAKKMGYKF